MLRHLALVTLLFVPTVSLAEEPLSPSSAPTASPTQPGPTLLEAGRNGAPDRFRYDNTVPEGFTLVERPKWGFFAAGLPAFLVGYGLMLLWLPVSPLYAIPIANPFVLIADMLGGGSTGGGLGGFVAGLFIAFAVTDFVLQAGGLTLAILAFTHPQRWLEKTRPSGPQVTILPTGSGSPLGISLAGRF